MPSVKFTSENLKERTHLAADWYTLKVISVSEGLSKAKDSTVWTVDLVVSKGNNAGVPVRHWFSEKAMGRLVEFINCFTGGSTNADTEYDLDELVGREVSAMVAYDTEFGNNKVSDWAPAR